MPDATQEHPGSPQPAGAAATAERVAELLASYDDAGYVVIEGAVSADTVELIRDELNPWLAPTAPLGRNDFEGHRTNRVYALLAKAPSIARLVEHELVLAMLDRLLLPNYLLSANLAINLLPGETAQAFHFDDSFYVLPRPRPPVSVSAIWALDHFTEENGATEIIPGSHRWGDREPEKSAAVERVVMSAGSVVVFAGTLWHRGGANRSSKPRLCVTPQYAQPWARQQELQVLAVGSHAARYSERIRELLGFSIHPPFMGHVNGLHPSRLIGDLPPGR